MTERRELKPCLCGGHATHHQFAAGDGKRIAAQIRCDDCGESTPVIVRNSVLKTGQAARAAWNCMQSFTRPLETQHD